jgi:FKBP12-rapamycin complex-associated protein
LISKLLNGECLPQEAGVLELLYVFSILLSFKKKNQSVFSLNLKAPLAEFSAPAKATKMNVNQQHLKKAWDTTQISTREDWIQWMHRIEVEFMKESPSHALRACMSLVDIPRLTKELFNAAFLSCWGELYDQYQVRTPCLHSETFFLSIV